MAIKIKNESHIGIVVPNIYAKVGAINGDKNIIYFTMNHHVIQENGQIEPTPYASIGFVLTPDVSDNSLNIIKQCYEHAKLNPKYAVGEDC